MKTSHIKTVLVLTLSAFAVCAGAAEVAGGGSSTGVSAGASDGTTGKPMIKYLSGPTKKPKTAEEVAAEKQQQQAEMQQILQAMGVAFGPGQPNTIVNANGNFAEVAGPGETGFTASGGGDGKPVLASQLTGTAKIIEPFKYWFDKCTQDLGLGICKFINVGIEPDGPHRARQSCHNSGTAIDVGPLTCANGNAAPGDPQFLKVADCLANNANNVLQVIFFQTTGGNMIQKSDHVGHMHVQTMHCPMIYGGG